MIHNPRLDIHVAMNNATSTATFLLWNLNGRDCSGLIAQLASQCSVDIAILLETGESQQPGLLDSPLISAICESTPFLPTPAVANKVSVLSRSEEFGLHELFFDPIKRFTLRRLRCLGEELLLAAVHLPCKLHWTEADQAAQAILVASRLRELETEHGNPGTILVGDFNMNPFEAGMVGAPGFHGMMSLDSTYRGTRTVQDDEYPFFYNPMWSYFGDRTPGPAGTYFQRRSAPICYDWNMVDQVLVRPSLLKPFEVEVEIVSRIGDTDLLTRRGRPRKNVGSDHLPVLFHLRKR